MRSAAPWQSVEIALESSRDRDNPYLDVEVEAVFAGPDGRVIRRPAFWDGGRVWRVRFAPTAAGRWRYSTAASDRTDAGLHAVAGELTSTEVEASEPVYRHGFLRASADGTHLAHADGAPFFWLGDTHWRFASERWDESNKPGWPSQGRGMVDRRVAQGFTVYLTNILSFEGSWAGPSPWVDDDGGERVDVAYFQSTLDPRMAYVANSGLVNALGFGWFTAIDAGAERMARLARYFVARYGSYPMVWTLAGEVAGYDLAQRAERIEGWRRVALAIRDADAYEHPRTAHLTTERPIAAYYQGEDWLTFTLQQHAHGDLDLGAHHYTEHLAAFPGVPLVEGESLYEGLISAEPSGRRPVTAAMVRQSAYRAIQSGCCGYSYGAQGCWNAAWTPEDAVSTWGDLPWYEGIELPGGTQLGHLRRFYEALDWASLRPESACFETASAFNTRITRPLFTANEARTTIVGFFGETYRNHEGPAALVGLPGAAYRLRWFDPRRGGFTLIEEEAVAESGRIALPDKPDDDDWVLLAELAR